MVALTTAIIAGAVIGGGAAIIGASKASGAAKDASRAQVQASNQALDVQMQQFREQQATQAPFLESGLNATNKLNALFGLPQTTAPTSTPQQPAGAAPPKFGGGRLGGLLNQLSEQGVFTPSAVPAPQSGLQSVEAPQDIAGAQEQAFADFETSPGFQFRLDEAQRAVESSAAARGGLLSGKGLRGETEVSQNIASQEFGNYVSALQSLAGLGPTAAAQQNQASSTFAANQSTSLANIGNARASGFINQANAFTGGLQGVANAASFGLGQLGQFGGRVPSDPSGAAASALAGQNILFG